MCGFDGKVSALRSSQQCMHPIPSDGTRKCSTLHITSEHAGTATNTSIHLAHLSVLKYWLDYTGRLSLVLFPTVVWIGAMLSLRACVLFDVPISLLSARGMDLRKRQRYDIAMSRKSCRNTGSRVSPMVTKTL